MRHLSLTLVLIFSTQSMSAVERTLAFKQSLVIPTSPSVIPSRAFVIPAKAGIHSSCVIRVDSRLRGNDSGAKRQGVVELPPVTVDVESKPAHPDVMTRRRLDTQVMGTVSESESSPIYLGTQWSERFSEISLFDIDSNALSIPALDLGLFDLRFFSRLTESPLSSQLTLNPLPRFRDPLEHTLIAQAGTDAHENTFLRLDFKPAQHSKLRIQLSQLFSWDRLRFYDERQTFFTSADDVIREDPSSGHHRLQAAATYQDVTATHTHALSGLYVFKHQNSLPYPPIPSEAHQDRQLALINASLKWRKCEIFDARCELSITNLLYQSWLFDPGRDLFLGIDSQVLKHGDLALQLRTTHVLSSLFVLKPELILQGSLTELRSRDLLGAASEIHNSRIQLGARLELESTLDAWFWAVSSEIRAVSDEISGVSTLGQTVDLSTKIQYSFDIHHSAEIGARYVERLPSFFERFGSFGTIRGNPNLKTEGHWAFQLGSHHRMSAGPFKFKAQTVGFVNIYHNLIHFLPNAQLIHIPQNISSALAYGAQSLVSIETSTWSETHLKLGWIRPREIFPTRSVALPGISELSASVIQTYIPWTFFRLWVALTYKSGLAFDSAAQMPFPNSLTHHAGLRWDIQNTPLSLQLDVHNLTDQLSGTSTWPTASQDLTLPVLERWGHPQRGRLILLTLQVAEK